MIKGHKKDCYDMNEFNDDQMIKKDSQVYIYFED